MSTNKVIFPEDSIKVQSKGTRLQGAPTCHDHRKQTGKEATQHLKTEQRGTQGRGSERQWLLDLVHRRGQHRAPCTLSSGPAAQPAEDRSLSPPPRPPLQIKAMVVHHGTPVLSQSSLHLA